MNHQGADCHYKDPDKLIDNGACVYGKVLCRYSNGTADIVIFPRDPIQPPVYKLNGVVSPNWHWPVSGGC